MSREAQSTYDLFSEISETNQLPWWEWDVPSNRVTTSPLKVTMIGYDPADFAQAGYQAFTDLLHPDDYEPSMQAMRDHLEGRARLYQIDYRIRMKSGEYTWYLDRGAILTRTDDGSPGLLRGVVFDLGPDLHRLAHDEAVVNAVRAMLPRAEKEGTVVVCAQCARMRYERFSWVELGPAYKQSFPGELSHSLCPDCIRLLYPEEADQIISRLSKYTPM